MAANAYEDTCLADSPSFLLPMGEASGNLTDIVGSKVGTVSGTPTYGVAGPVEGKTAIAFSADTQFFTFADHADLDIGNVFTVEAWLRRDSDSGGFEMAVAKLGGGAYGLGGNNADQIQLARVGVETVSQATATNPANGQWHLWAVTHSAVGAGNTIIYQNGVAVAVTDGPGIGNALVDTTGDLIIGREGAGNRWPGAIAYPAIYPTVLAPARLASHFAARNGYPNRRAYSLFPKTKLRRAS